MLKCVHIYRKQNVAWSGLFLFFRCSVSCFYVVLELDKALTTRFSIMSPQLYLEKTFNMLQREKKKENDKI